MFKLLNNIIKYCTRRRQNLTVNQTQTNNTLDNRYDNQAGYNLIEINRDEQPIPGMVTQNICTDKRLLETPTGGIITVGNKEGIRCGCNHFIYAIEPNDTQPGLGGQCPICMTEAADILTKGQISLSQAEAMSLYCTLCSSRCDNCGRSICKKHTQQFTNSDASINYLCPDCIKQAERNRLLKQTLTVMLSPFVDDSQLPSQKERKPNDE